MTGVKERQEPESLSWWDRLDGVEVVVDRVSRELARQGVDVEVGRRSAMCARRLLARATA